MARLTSEQKSERRKCITASEFPIICGVHPFRTPGDVYLWKTQDLEDDEEEPGSPSDFGHRVEPLILDYVEEMLECKVERDVPTQRHPSGYLMAHPDGLIETPEGLRCVDAKSTGMKSRWTHGVPDFVDLQVLAQVACTPNAVDGVVGVVFADYGFRCGPVYVVDYPQERIDKALRICEAWWERHIVAGVPPKDPPTYDQTLRIIQDLDLPPAVLDGSLYHAMKEAEEAKAKANRDHDAIKATIRFMAGASTVVHFLGYPEREIFTGERSRRGYTVEPTTYRDFKERKRKS